ncbi:MAG: hypothetical protein IJT32_06900, partial [Lachnospiraceae bacterium]|nr:hypothetical protein [Lachnospiraceae bacterium]
MPGNNEDYLDGLLDSITKAKSTARSSERRERSGREERIARRSRIRPEDDFMEANGLYDGSSRRRGRRDRRDKKRVFDDDFFDDLDGGLSDDDDYFIRAFERELARGGDDVFDIMDIDKEDDFFAAGEDTPAKSAKESSPKDAVLGDIASIVSEAKAKIEEGNSDLLNSINEQMNAPAPESFTAGVPGGAPADTPASASEENVLGPEYAEDELDLSDVMANGTEAQEVPLMDDELGDDLNLMDMLASEGDEGVDIGELLTSDETGEELSETREAFEAGAKSAESGGSGVESREGANSAEAEKKPGLLARILSIFKKTDAEDDATNVGIVDPSLEQLAAESEELAEDYDEDEDDEDGESPEEKKARKKKEKEEEKAKKKKEKEE